MRTTNTLRLITLAWLSLAWLPAAAQEQGICRACNRTIEEQNRKFSVTVPKTTGMESSAFNDIGCAVVWRNGECAMRQSAFDSTARVRDYETGEEIAMDAVYFVVGSGVKTPEGYDVVAFRDKGRAERFAAQQGKGKVLKLFELVDVKLK